MTNLVNIKIIEDYSTIEGIIILNDKKAFEHNAKDKINEYIFGGNICNSELRKECNDSSIYCFICQVKYIKCPLFLFFHKYIRFSFNKYSVCKHPNKAYLVN